MLSKFKVLQLFLLNISLPISILVLLPSINIASVLSEGKADGCPLLAYDVPMFTFDISIVSTGVSLSNTLSVLVVISSLNCSSSSELGISDGARYTPASRLLNDLSANIVSFTTTPVPTVEPTAKKLIAICGLNPSLRSMLYGLAIT